MINVTVIAVGRLKESYLRDGCGEYVKRLSAYAKVNITFEKMSPASIGGGS